MKPAPLCAPAWPWGLTSWDLLRRQSLISDDGRHRLVLQPDGDLVLVQLVWPGRESSGVPVWASETAGSDVRIARYFGRLRHVRLYDSSNDLVRRCSQLKCV